MSKNLRNCLQQLILVAKIKNVKLRKSLLKEISCDPAIYRALHEIAINTVKGKIPFTAGQKRKLIRHAKLIKALAKPTKCIKTRKRLVQKGGLPLLPLLIPAAASIISAIINRNK